jgi:hypothetical protein
MLSRLIPYLRPTIGEKNGNFDSFFSYASLFRIKNKLCGDVVHKMHCLYDL